VDIAIVNASKIRAPCFADRYPNFNIQEVLSAV
jgi:hypothetical protein